MKIEMYNVPFVFIAFISADQRYFWLEALVWKDGLRADSFPFPFSSVHFRILITEKSEENCLQLKPNLSFACRRNCNMSVWDKMA